MNDFDDHRVTTLPSRLAPRPVEPRPTVVRAAPAEIDGHSEALAAEGGGPIEVLLLDERRIASLEAGQGAAYEPAWSETGPDGERLLLWRPGPAPAPKPSPAP